MAQAYGVGSRRERKRAVLVGAVLALVVAANVFIALLIVTGLRPFQDVEDSGLAAVLPEERVLEFFGVGERDRERPAAREDGALAASAGGGGSGVSTGGGADSFPTGFVQQAAARIAGPGQQPVLVAPVAGTTEDGQTFRGTLYIERFIVRDGRLFLIGRVSGTVTDSAGNVIYRVDDLLVRLPVEIDYVDGTLVLELGDLLLPELGLTVELEPLIPDAADASGPQVDAFLEHVAAVAELVESGAPADEVASQLNELVSSSGTSYEDVVRGLAEAGGGSEGGDGTTGTDAATEPTETTGSATTTETETTPPEEILPTTTVDTTAVPTPPSASAKAKNGATPACPKGTPKRLCDLAP